MDKFESMGKEALRAACKAAGISYGKLNNDGMRTALRAKEFEQPARVEPVQHADEHYVALAAKMDLTKLGLDGIEGHCPCCGIDLSNGVATHADIAEHNKPAAAEMVHNVVCLGCNGEWGPLILHPVKHEDRHSGTGLKIEKVREKRNGVTRPSAGGKCRQVWDALDAYRTEQGELPTVAIAKSIAEDEGWNPANATIEFYQWRKFNGIKGRGK
jgi:hypothetical protein